MMNCLQSWPEPIVRVQSLSDSDISVIPDRYVKRPSHRPSFLAASEPDPDPSNGSMDMELNNIPVIDLQGLLSNDEALRQATLKRISGACRDWGFFQVVNHGVDHHLMLRAREIWRHFFRLPIQEKQVYANSPLTYEGYGSRLGVEKNAILDWSDYFFLHYLPESFRNPNKWPELPPSCRELVAKYCEELVELCGKLMKAFSINLGLGENYLQEAFGGEDIGACLRINYYPKCPQPELTLGLSAHSDPGGMTLLLPDDVSGLQVRRGDRWLTVKHVPDAFIVNIGDQIQVLSNANYKSVEHRVTVNSTKERVSLAFFYNPRGDLLIEPAKELVSEDQPPLYRPMTYNEYRVFIRTKGPCGKSQVDSLKTSC